uniref:Uncharacterized protein n=1 Tax=Micrurus spixii TaxID=129469 RepID=A0A2D4NBE2_9SAUR
MHRKVKIIILYSNELNLDEVAYTGAAFPGFFKCYLLNEFFCWKSESNTTYPIQTKYIFLAFIVSISQFNVLLFFFQECVQNKNYRKEMKAKVEDLGEKSKLLQAKGHEEGLEIGPLQTQITGHASASNYRKPQRSEDPVSTANTFQPGAWMPPDHKK